MRAYFYGFLLSCILLSSCILEGGVPGPAGGYVFYDKGEYTDGWRYLECAPEDSGGDVSWSEAAASCEDYRLGGYDGWRLPTRAELRWMYDNLHKKGMGNFKAHYNEHYWSSEEYSPGYSSSSKYYYYFNFDDGDIGQTYPSSSSSYDYYARPVRQF